MVRKNMTLHEIRREGLQALLDRLGPAGTVRFLQQYEAGQGDYSRERELLLPDWDAETLVRQARERARR